MIPQSPNRGVRPRTNLASSATTRSISYPVTLPRPSASRAAATRLFCEIDQLEKRALVFLRRKLAAEADLAATKRAIADRIHARASDRNPECVTAARLESIRGLAAGKAKVAGDQLGAVNKQLMPLRKRLAKYSIAQPRVPTEILQQIFEILHEMGVGERGPFGAAKLPYYLGTVCGRWRDITRSTPQLWTHFRLPKIHSSMNPDPLPLLQLQSALCGDFQRNTSLIVEIGLGHQWNTQVLPRGLYCVIKRVLTHVSTIVIECENSSEYRHWGSPISGETRDVLGLVRGHDIPKLLNVTIRNKKKYSPSWSHDRDDIKNFFKEAALKRVTALRIENFPPAQNGSFTAFPSLTEVDLIMRGSSVSLVAMQHVINSAPRLQRFNLIYSSSTHYDVSGHAPPIFHRNLRNLSLRLANLSSVFSVTGQWDLPKLETFKLTFTPSLTKVTRKLNSIRFLATDLGRMSPLLGRFSVSGFGETENSGMFQDIRAALPRVEEILLR
ncbi:hypothetical protein BKA62DRAFT_722419 [Auriculariales sp. MPI-PUGE-AT-0066]|nr:hypothetical protein BKA62DRAFT_722419 [Auriculariales sp. MPI-PUGE-AT-0066]